LKDLLNLDLTAAATGSPSFSGSQALAVVAIFAFIMVVALAMAVLGSIFSFIYYDSLLDKQVSIRDRFSQFSGKGIRLFGFTFGLLLLALFLIGGIIGLGVVNPLLSVFGVLLLIPVFLALFAVNFVTSEFIPLVMIEKDIGVIEAWKDKYDLFKAEWKQLFVYLLLKMALRFVSGIIGLFAGLMLGFMVAIPFGILGFLAYIVFKPLAIIAAILGLLTWVALSIYLIGVPINTYFRYYAILMYHDLTV
ncbi:MAG: hypothetical protein ABEI78_00775, partial [Candidatus Nanohaloarchaea archaeon]